MVWFSPGPSIARRGVKMTMDLADLSRATASAAKGSFDASARLVSAPSGDMIRSMSSML